MTLSSITKSIFEKSRIVFQEQRYLARREQTQLLKGADSVAERSRPGKILHECCTHSASDTRRPWKVLTDSVLRGRSTSACHAVFGTYELLENIILHVPPAELVSKKRVAKYWNAVICDSKRVRQTYCLAPLRQHNVDVTDVYELMAGACGLMYPRGANLELHPSVQPPCSPNVRYKDHRIVRGHQRMYESARGLSIPCMYKSIRGLSVSSARGGMEYLTRPPCKAVDLFFHALPFDERADVICTLYRADGLRVEDLMIVSEAILRQVDRKYKNSVTYSEFGLRLMELVDESEEVDI